MLIQYALQKKGTELWAHLTVSKFVLSHTNLSQMFSLFRKYVFATKVNICVNAVLPSEIYVHCQSVLVCLEQLVQEAVRVVVPNIRDVPQHLFVLHLSGSQKRRRLGSTRYTGERYPVA